MEIDRNADIIRRIMSYCYEIEEAVERFGADYAVFSHDSVYRNALPGPWSERVFSWFYLQLGIKKAPAVNRCGH